MVNKQPHILLRKRDIGSFALLPGDPDRATKIARDYLEKGKLVAQYREFRSYTGYYNGAMVTVVSTGIGSPSAAIVTEELINLGAKILIRVGTCGGALKKEIDIGSIIIPTASIREEGTTKEYMSSEFPAVADFEVVTALIQAAKKGKFRYFAGINRTHDAFYGKTANIKGWGSLYLEPRMKNWAYPLISSEMECAPIFLISLLRGVKAGAVLAVNYTPEPLQDIMLGKQRFEAPGTHLTTSEARKSVDRAIVTALDAGFEVQKR